MNQRELGELRRRFRPEKSAISRVYGCYVNSSREIIRLYRPVPRPHGPRRRRKNTWAC